MKKNNTIFLFLWALYDWANSAFSAIIQTFVFATYFTQSVVENPIEGSYLWGHVMGISGLLISILGPLFGAIADQGKKRKKWLLFFSLQCIIPTSLLWFVKPNSSSTELGIWLIGIAVVGSELAFVFYNAMLPSLCTPDTVGKWSGWGWGLGYLGGLTCLCLAFILFLNDNSLFFKTATNSEQIRATFPLTAIWYLIFSLPLFIFVPTTSGNGLPVGEAIKKGMGQLANTLTKIKKYKEIFKFLTARMFYLDALTTLFAFAGVYAATLVGMKTKEILVFGIFLNLSSGIGAFFFAFLDDIWGGKRLIILSLIGIIVPSFLLFIHLSATTYWIVGLIGSLFVGPLQAGSRSMMARITPPHLMNEMFGFFALSGKATSFLGPLLISLVTVISKNQIVGLGVIITFFAFGLLIMLTVKSDTNPNRVYDIRK